MSFGATTQNALNNATGAVYSATGNLLLSFGGINLGNQDIPLNQQSLASSNQPATIGTTPTAQAAANPANYWPIFVVAGVTLLLFLRGKHK